MNELKEYIRQNIFTSIFDKLRENNIVQTNRIASSSKYKTLHEAASYFFEKKLPRNIPEDISHLISTSLLQCLSKEELSQIVLYEQLPDNFIQIINDIKERKLKTITLSDIDVFIDKMYEIIDNKLYAIDEIILVYSPQLINDTEEYITKTIENNIKKEELAQK